MVQTDRPPRRILVVKLATLGDLLTATPALRSLRSSFPGAHLAVLCTPGSAPLLRCLETVDEVIPLDKTAFDRPLGALRQAPSAAQFGVRLRRGNWDTVVLLHHLTTRFGTAKYAALTFASGAPVRVGLDNGRGRAFLTHRAVDHGFGVMHEVEYWVAVTSVLGAIPVQPLHLEIVLRPADREWAEQQWRAFGVTRALLIGPGSGAFSRARRWAPERFAEIGRLARERFALSPLVLGGTSAEEHQLAAAVAAGCGGSVVPQAPTPQALAALIGKCFALVANDSGPVHLAAAMETPVVAVFGPTNARAWGPYPVDSPRNQVVRDPVVCSPCIHRGHQLGTPQGCPARTCLAIVSAASVLDGLARAVSSRAAETALAGSAE